MVPTFYFLLLAQCFFAGASVLVPCRSAPILLDDELCNSLANKTAFLVGLRTTNDCATSADAELVMSNVTTALSVLLPHFGVRTLTDLRIPCARGLVTLFFSEGKFRSSIPQAQLLERALLRSPSPDAPPPLPPPSEIVALAQQIWRDAAAPSAAAAVSVGAAAIHQVVFPVLALLIVGGLLVRACVTVRHARRAHGTYGTKGGVDDMELATSNALRVYMSRGGKARGDLAATPSQLEALTLAALKRESARVGMEGGAGVGDVGGRVGRGGPEGPFRGGRKAGVEEAGAGGGGRGDVERRRDLTAPRESTLGDEVKAMMSAMREAHGDVGGRRSRSGTRGAKDPSSGGSFVQSFASSTASYLSDVWRVLWTIGPFPSRRVRRRPAKGRGEGGGGPAGGRHDLYRTRVVGGVSVVLWGDTVMHSHPYAVG